MASSAPSYLYKDDVFLSFRSIDTRNNIVSHLLRALQNSKIQTFIDYGLNIEDKISAGVMKAIEGCKISVIIFSEKYADSKRCLDELVKILECKEELNQIVIPVFYKVHPTDVRNQTGEFGAAFLQNITALESGKEQIWRNALKTAANLSGFHALNNGSEATLVDTIIADVLEKLKIGSNNAYEDLGYVGINSRMEQMMRILDFESPDLLMVGIWGMGGIGKTTIAEALFNQISLKFGSYCFLANVREKAKKEGLASMRDNLISELLKDDTLKIRTPPIGDTSIKEVLEIQTPLIGDALTKNRLRRMRVLVVLDDVDDTSQLEVLIGERGTNPFGRGSRVIVTTRDKQVLNAHDITDVYEMKLLNDDEALQLFFYHALRPKQRFEPYQEFSTKVVEYAKGLPLALKVLGSSLRGKTDIRDWVGALKKLKKVPHLRILDVLKISYDSLEKEEKDLFLDIACFFKGASFDTVKNVLDGCYISLHSGMSVLVDKSLITINHRNISVCDMTARASFDAVEMHELVQEMGWNIVTGESEKPGSRSRLWRTKDVCDVLTETTGTDKIKSILLNLDMSDVNAMNLDSETFAKMYNLKFLKIMDPNSKIQFPSSLNSLPDRLKYLYWQGYPLECLPPTFNPNNLVEIYISSYHLERLWTERQNLCNLKALCLRFCKKLIEIPDLSLAENLNELNVNGCPKVTKFPYVSKNIEFLEVNGTLVEEDQSSLAPLTQLVSLVLWDCTDYQKSDTFLEIIKAVTPSNCQITFSETEDKKSEVTVVDIGMEE